MDPLCSVFSITGSDSGSMNGDTLVHPGDSTSPLEIIEWLDRVDEKLDATSYGSVRRGDIPAKLLRETEPIDIDVVSPALREGTGIDANDVARRASERAKMTAENGRKTAERKATLRDYKNRIAAVLNTAMRESALRTLNSGEHAIEGREGHAAMWTLPSMARLVTAMGALFTSFDQCVFGAEYPVPRARRMAAKRAAGTSD